MNLLENPLYRYDIKTISDLPYDWNALRNKKIIISGASGMIGSFLIDVLMHKNLHCKIFAIGRNAERAQKRFVKYWENEYFSFVEGDINQGINIDIDKIDYVFHAASNTHPVAYATDPINTIITNIIGTFNLLEFATKHCAKRFVFLSSVEVYGENREDCQKFTEAYCGYIDCNTLRAGYPESKRAGEALCQAYMKQKGLSVIIPRLARVYGPTMLMSDTKALSQFIKKGIADEDIVLKSEGMQFYSYCYVADAVSGILMCLLNGNSGEAYNIAGLYSDITLKNLAGIIADYNQKKIIYELPDQEEKCGYSKAMNAVLDCSKICSLGWEPKYDLKRGLLHTLKILEETGIR